MHPLEILSIIPARGGSKGIPRKNIKSIGTKPLLAFTADASINSKYLTRHILSTDDDEIAQIGIQYGLEVPFLRPSALAADHSPSIDCIQYTLNQLYRIDNYRPDLVVVLQPTSPLRTHVHVDQAISLFLDSDCDSLVSIVEVPHNMSPPSALTRDNDGYIFPFIESSDICYQRQSKPIFYARNGAAIYITTPEIIYSKSSLFGDSIIGYLMSKIDSIDIDDLDDFSLVEALLYWRTK